MPITVRNIKDQEDVTLTINLTELFGQDINDLPAQRLALGQAIIDKIIERTKNGEFLNPKAKETYSTEYVKSDDFQAFGKSKSNVNLTLTGHMLSSLDIKESDVDKIVIGFDSELESEKAHGHITGKRGKSPDMKRDFFGLPKSVLEDIAQDFENDFTETRTDIQDQNIFKKETKSVQDLINSLDLFKNIFGNING